MLLGDILLKASGKKADELISKIEANLDEVNNNLKHLTDYAIRYFEQILKKHGKNHQRKTEIAQFDTIRARRVAAANVKLFLNRKDVCIIWIFSERHDSL